MIIHPEVIKNFQSQWWRLNHFYYLVDKRGSKILFKFNWAQQHLYENLHTCNIILKARQLGISTFVLLLLLDEALFKPNTNAGIIAQTREDAEGLFKRIKFAYDNLPPAIKAEIQSQSNSARELEFSNGSRISVGTSMRGSTLHLLHISEFGKICAKYPEKAQEIITGSLNTLAPGQKIYIESTAEGKEGYFYEMCQRAEKMNLEKKQLSEIDFKFHFFPWWGEPSYQIGSPINLTQEDYDYFYSLEVKGIKLLDTQKWWYSAKAYEQKDNMKREFPSTPQESWEQSTEGTYYGKYMRQARIDRRVCHVEYDPTLEVHTSWDLGWNDQTSIFLFQLYGKEIRLIEYIEGHGQSLSEWINVLKRKDYTYGTHLAPHDIKVHEYSTGMSRQSFARKLGFNLIAVPKVEIIAGIDMVRNIFGQLWFNEVKCSKAIRALENYKKEWNDKLGCWDKNPLHNEYSHCADALRCLATGLHIITGRKTQAELDRLKLNQYKDHTGFLPGSMFYEGNQNNRSFF